MVYKFLRQIDRKNLVVICLCFLFIIIASLYFAKNFFLNDFLEDSEENNTDLATSASSTAKVLAKKCSFNTTGIPLHKSIIINEIAWMGTLNNANDEWIELKNISPEVVDIHGWSLINSNEKIKISFGNGKEIPSGGLLLLGRKQILPDGLKVDMMYKGSLKNTGDSLRVFDQDCHVVDEVLADAHWPAGVNATKKTMERSADMLTTIDLAGNPKLLTWHTSLIAGGTPKQENTKGVTNMVNEKKVTVIKKEAITQKVSPNIIDSELSKSTQIEAVTPALKNSGLVVISQVQITGGKGKADDDFIEIHNQTNEKFNLKGYRLIKRTEAGTTDIVIKSWTNDTFIPAYGFYLWANSNYKNSTIAPDTTTTGNLGDNNGIALRFGPSNSGIIIDSLAWGKANNIFTKNFIFSSNPKSSQSLLRNGLNFELVEHSNPRNSQSNLLH